jgi:diguanylate cyclase
MAQVPAPAPTAPADPRAPAQLAKGALRRLAQARQEPTPANFARAYAEEAAQVGADAAAASPLPARARPLAERLAARASDDSAQREELARALMEARWDDLQRALDRAGERAADQSRELAGLIERIARGLERGGKAWSSARKKESLQRVLDGSRSDAQRLQQRLSQLVAAWDSGAPLDDEAPAAGEAPAAAEPATAAAAAAATPPAAARTDPGPLVDVVADLQTTLGAALPADEPRAAELADELAGLAGRIAREGASPELVTAVQQACQRARRLLAHRHHLVDELAALCRNLSEGLTELVEDDSWTQGQCEQLREHLASGTADAGAGGLTARGVRAAGDLLDATRIRQRELRGDRERARQALKAMIGRMLEELGELGQHTGRFNDKVAGYADVIAQADSLESLADVVREMVADTRAVHQLVSGARERLTSEHARATELESKVRELEGELRKLSQEVSTDVLTQVANRRGMMAAFEVEQARLEREGTTLAVGLIDIDNFKKLNDTLGHAAGDEALKALAARVKGWLRPVDHLARFGGEEFVVLLPGTAVEEAQQVLTRLQRQLTASLFMHDGQEVFVTFSAGVTAYRSGEPLEAALERADEGLYEAKRTGKNRTCIT